MFRIIIPVYPEENIYSYSKNAKSVVAIGPVIVATIVNKLWGWRVEIIDENNCNGLGCLDKDGLPDHTTLQIQNTADVVGFYCGLTSTMERVGNLAKLYQELGVKTVAGGWHASYCPEETLLHNIDVVLHGDGEPEIRRIIYSLNENLCLDSAPGISFLKDGKIFTTPKETNIIQNLDGLPFPDFGLVRGAKIKVYSLSRIRGCSMRCEFCSVNTKARWASPEYLFENVEWLVETRRARKFFIVDDRLEEDMPGTMRFFEMITEKYGNRLSFFVQTRLGIAKSNEFIKTMKAAGVKTLFIGCESPIDEDLSNMRKGYTSKDMIGWVKILRQNFWIHGMFIFGYPPKEKRSQISPEEMGKRFRTFIKKAKFDSVQILKPIPLPGAPLRERLEKEGRIFPLNVVPWSRYDGNSVCFMPDNMSLKQLQEIPMKLMAGFYHRFSFFRVILRTIIFPIDYLLRGWRSWYIGWYRDLVKYVGSIIIKRWKEKYKESRFLEKLENYCKPKKQ